MKVYVSGVGRGEPSVTGIEQQKGHKFLTLKKKKMRRTKMNVGFRN